MNDIVLNIDRVYHNTISIISHFKRAIAFSKATYGPGARTEGVIAHIRKELEEIEQAETPEDRAAEWVDIIVLGVDGLWRSLFYENNIPWINLSDAMVDMWLAKQNKNEQRDWPDWRQNDGTTPIEHVRGGEHD